MNRKQKAEQKRLRRAARPDASTYARENATPEGRQAELRGRAHYHRIAATLAAMGKADRGLR